MSLKYSLVSSKMVSHSITMPTSINYNYPNSLPIDFLKNYHLQTYIYHIYLFYNYIYYEIQKK